MPSSAAKAMAGQARIGLLDLPVELLLNIAEFAGRTTQKNLCLTCSILRMATVPSLFREIKFTLGGQKDRGVASLEEDIKGHLFAESKAFQNTSLLNFHFFTWYRGGSRLELDTFVDVIMPRLTGAMQNLQLLHISFNMGSAMPRVRTSFPEFMGKMCDAYASTLGMKVELFGLVGCNYRIALEGIRNIKMLTIWAVVEGFKFDEGYLAHTLTRCPNLQSLELSVENLDFEEVVSRLDEDAVEQLHELKLYRGKAPYTLESLQKIRNLRNLTLLDVTGENPAPPRQEEVWKTLQRANLRLRSLDLNALHPGVVDFLGCKLQVCDLTGLKMNIYPPLCRDGIDLETFAATATKFRQRVLPIIMPRLQSLSLLFESGDLVDNFKDEEGDPCDITPLINGFGLQSLLQSGSKIGTVELTILNIMDNLLGAPDPTLDSLAELLEQSPKLSHVFLYLYVPPHLQSAGYHFNAMNGIASWTPTRSLATGVQLEVFIRRVIVDHYIYFPDDEPHFCLRSTTPTIEGGSELDFERARHTFISQREGWRPNGIFSNFIRH